MAGEDRHGQHWTWRYDWRLVAALAFTLEASLVTRRWRREREARTAEDSERSRLSLGHKISWILNNINSSISGGETLRELCQFYLIIFSPDHSGLLDGFVHSGESLGLPELLRPPPHLSVLPRGCVGLGQTLETLSCPSSHSLRLSVWSLLTGVPLPAGEELSLWALHLPHSRLEQAYQVRTEKVLHLLSAMF